MRSVHLLLPALLVMSCVDKPVEVPPPPPIVEKTQPVVEETQPNVLETQEPATDVQLAPLTGTGLKFDGAYRFTIGDLQYYMRFFERGSAAFVGGT
jgi:hypothetical protein